MKLYILKQKKIFEWKYTAERTKQVNLFNITLFL